ncbi:MoaD/ThiS family protein [Chloroflexota bacterium]
MLVKTKFMGHFVDLFGAEKDVELERGANLHDLAMAVCTSKDCYQALFTDEGKPKPEVEIMRKGSKVQLLHEANTKLSSTDVITFYPHIAI